MWPYWMLFGLFASGAVLTPPDSRRLKPISVPLLFGALIIIIMLGLRYRTGVDWGNYYRQWIGAESLTFSDLVTQHNGDAGFYGLMWSLKNAGFDYWSLNLVCAAVFTTGLVAFARRLPNPWLAVAVAAPYLITVIAMSATRQATALGFVFLALVAFSDRRTLAFLGWTAAATLFHASAILTLPFAGLSFAKNRFQAVLLGLVIVVLGWLTLGSPFAAYSRRYLNETVQSSGTLYRVAMAAVAAVLYLALIRRRIPLPDHERSLWRNYSLFALAAIPIAAAFPTSTALDRALIYLFPLQIFVLSLVPYASQRGSSPFFPIVAILLYLSAILFVFLNFGVNAEGFVPYRIYWLSSGGGP